MKASTAFIWLAATVGMIGNGKREALMAGCAFYLVAIAFLVTGD